jgi:hypothetical protein
MLRPTEFWTLDTTLMENVGGLQSGKEKCQKFDPLAAVCGNCLETRYIEHVKHLAIRGRRFTKLSGILNLPIRSTGMLSLLIPPICA